MKCFKISCVVLGVVFVAADVGVAQESEFAKHFKSEFAVPQSPAFTLLGGDPSTMLRPGTVRDLALEVASFFTEEGDFALPQDIGVEFSPGLLVQGPRLSLRAYQEDPALYRFRISLATTRIPEKNGATAVSCGFRTTLIDGADLRGKTADVLREKNRLLTKEAFEVEEKVKNRLIEDGTYEPGDPIPAAAITAQLTAAEQELVASLDGRLRASYEEFLDANWNASVWEVAFGILGQSEDSTGRGLVGEKLVVWTTYGLPVGTLGQWLLGTTLGSSREGSGEMELFEDASTRFYIGRNGLKAFVEGGGSFQAGRRPTWLLHGGSEIRTPWDLWLTVLLGVDFEDTDGGDPHLVSHLAMRVPFMR